LVSVFFRPAAAVATAPASSSTLSDILDWFGLIC
jgi:hypothetical protein